MTTRSQGDGQDSYLDHRVTLHVVLESLELEVQHRREALKDDALLRVLETVTLCLIPVLAVHRLYRDVVSERVVQVLHALDIELDVWRRRRASLRWCQTAGVCCCSP